MFEKSLLPFFVTVFEFPANTSPLGFAAIAADDRIKTKCPRLTFCKNMTNSTWNFDFFDKTLRRYVNVFWLKNFERRENYSIFDEKCHRIRAVE